MDAIVLIDLSSIAHPIWHTSASSANPDETSQQIVARVTALAAGAPHAAICMDAGRSFRHDICATYKANRPEREAALYHQIELAVDVLRDDGFPIWRVPGYEADDLIATAACRAMETDTPVVIVTGDKDLLQLVCPTVTIKSSRDGAMLDAAAVSAKFGVWPGQMRDYLVLVGDASDNVKGAKGIGPKRAAELLTTCGSIDEMYLRLDAGTVPGVTPAIRSSLAEFRAALDLTRQLITLRADAPIPFEELAAERQPRTPNIFPAEDDDMETEQDTQQEIDAAPAAAPVQAMVPREPDILAPAPAEWERQLEPRSMREAKLIAQDMHASRLFLGTYGTKESVLGTILAGRELGLQAMASLRAIHIVEGRPTLSADLIRALVIRSGLAKYFRCTERTAERATFETQRGDDPPIALTFTIEETRVAWAGTQDKWDKSGWGKNPADMLVARAGAKLARLVFPDVVHGIYAPEELSDARSEVA